MSEFIQSTHDSDITYSIFDMHCNTSHPYVAIDELLTKPEIPTRIHDDGKIDNIELQRLRTVLSFEGIEEIYLKMKEAIKNDKWCSCSRILEIQKEKN